MKSETKMEYEYRGKNRHGGDIYRNRIIEDYSVNTNPLGLPPLVKECILQEIDSLEHYPDPENRALIKAIAEYHQVKEEFLLCGNGASEILKLVVDSIQPKKALVLAPTFSGYEHALRGCGVEPDHYVLQEKDNFSMGEDFLEQLSADTDMIFLCNPNNPVGNCIHTEYLKKIADFCYKNSIYMVVDECFLEFLPDYQERSMKRNAADNPFLVIVNAFTKLYAMPGIRLGYGITSNMELRKRMAALQTEWSVSVMAQQAGIAALQEQAYVQQAVELIQQEREYLTLQLQRLGFKVYPSQSDFILFRSKADLYESLLSRGILIRNCNNYDGLSDGYYRIAVKTHEKNQLLMENIREIITEQR